MSDEKNLRDYINLVVEGRLREADISDGGRVPWGDDRHVSDLEQRIADMARWRDRKKKGTEERANYARIISRLKAELKSAKKTADARRAAEKKAIVLKKRAADEAG